jgi:NAD(P)-dependent dehydrogenase (short-subunit alcohol dehydrogenase family)
MDSKTIILTGATSGIGKQAAIMLAKMNHKLILTTRDDERGKEMKNEIVQSTNKKDIHVMYCDLASLNSVRTFCSDYKKRFKRLDILINNAAIWDWKKRRESADGIENIFATNYLAPFLITNSLLDLLKNSKPSRVVNVTSGLHKGPINFDDLEFNQGFKGMNVYSHSKLALMLFTKLLAEKLKGTGVTVNCVHPGLNRTRLGRDAGAFSRAIFYMIAKNPKMGAGRVVYLATSPDVANVTGEYFGDKKIDDPGEEAKDMAVARRLWDVTLDYVGLRTNE